MSRLLKTFAPDDYSVVYDEKCYNTLGELFGEAN